MKKTKKIPKKGEIWLVKFKRAKETPKTFRPCLVISNDTQNEFNDLIVVAPITTENIENIEPFEVYIENTPETGLDHPSKVLFIFPMTIDKELRLVGQQRLGLANKKVMQKTKIAWKIAFEWE
ncbi:type II toxin-antitoxin system PemK/MazF family toxin [endosymbiont GvMRE of Glomus versiforme]|uniref:type II toxin-antitoxin system PemK/MazF family toxin n=1 Tax=endosymbiont GvMRE of Glomus versiforme TaxID=2039283 RepID=UPI000EBFA2E7|nr:type II toxin-antitoxin system PemK/MazF family toxin [endosymbiont GvMRE of Glomus versiforme]RHZ36170.1 mRNA interferase [endosymbiont GvMRE of Glomus versiforme]